MQQYDRGSIQLKGFDYSSPGASFVTLVTYRGEALFGEITAGEVRLTPAGEVVREIWESLPKRYPQIELDESIVMPNHFHGILWIMRESSVGAVHELPLHELPLQANERRSSRRRMLFPLVIGYFKMNSSKQINQILGSQGVPVWQRNYYEHVVRNERELNDIRKYIQANPLHWEVDKENPKYLDKE